MTLPPAQERRVAVTCQLRRDLLLALQLRCEQQGETVDDVIAAALTDYLQLEHGTLYQVSTAGALVEGLYRGVVTVGDLREHGDFGLGTFAELDGEMVAVDGQFFQVRSDGSVREVGDDARSPYAMVTRFPQGPTVSLPDCSDIGALHRQLDQLRDSRNVFYAIRVDGEFDVLHARAAPKTAEGVPLDQATSNQVEFHLKQIRGTLVGFWSPAYLQTILVPGYHLHFLSADRTAGGHLFGCTARDLTARVRREADFRVTLPETSAFLNADLTHDPQAALERAERAPGEK